MTPEQKAKLARDFMEAIPHSRDLGMKITEIDNGRATVTMPYDERLIGDPATGVIHGGAVSALMDTCCGAAVVSHPRVLANTATLDLRIDYMRPATPGEMLTTKAHCYHATRTVAFVRATAYDADFERPVATATGSFTVDAAGAEKARGA